MHQTARRDRRDLSATHQLNTRMVIPELPGTAADAAHKSMRSDTADLDKERIQMVLWALKRRARATLFVLNEVRRACQAATADRRKVLGKGQAILAYHKCISPLF